MNQESLDTTPKKTNKLEYAYHAPESIAVYPMLGSLVRAIGKEWSVLVIAPEIDQVIFRKLREGLINPQLLQVISFADFVSENFTKNFDLVLSLYTNKKHNSFIRNNVDVLGKAHVMTIEDNPDREEYDLISDFDEFQLNETGVTAVTGTKIGGGKGKTTTALGIATESFVNGGKVAVVQWFKEKKSGDLTWAINEHNFPNLLKNPKEFEFYPTGAGFVGSPNMDRVTEESEHKQKAKDGVELAKKLIKSNDYSIIVLDEFVDTLQQVMNYLPYSLLSITEVQELLGLAQNSKTKVIVTGRQITPEWQHYIKTSIIISEVKHPWSSQQKGAVSGLDF